MPDAITYCDKCMRIILPGEIAGGDAVSTQHASLCPNCVKELSTGTHEALVGAVEAPPSAPMQPKPKKRHKTPTTKMRALTGSTRAHHPSTQRSRSGGSQVGISGSAIAIVAGLVLGIVVATAFVATSGGSRRKANRPEDSTQHTATTVTAPPPAAPPERAELTRLRERLASDLTNYASVRSAVEAFSFRYGDKPIAAEARVLLATIDTRYGQRADAALFEAIAQAKRLAAGGDRNAAVAAIRAIETRYGHGPWLRTRGQRKIDDAVRHIESAGSGRAPTNHISAS